jgi:hypothetical protein
VDVPSGCFRGVTTKCLFTLPRVSGLYYGRKPAEEVETIKAFKQHSHFALFLPIVSAFSVLRLFEGEILENRMVVVDIEKRTRHGFKEDGDEPRFTGSTDDIPWYVAHLGTAFSSMGRVSHHLSIFEPVFEYIEQHPHSVDGEEMDRV